MPRLHLAALATALTATALILTAPMAYSAQQGQAEPATGAVAVTAARPPVTAPGPVNSVRGTGTKAVALTFDDGPDPKNTPQLLDLLKQYNVKATFCVVGHRARDNQDIIKRMAAEGHTLCNHSWQHLQDLGLRDDKKIRQDLKATNREIRRAVPGIKIELFRAPYGNFTPRLNEIALELGMTPIFWDVDDDAYLKKKYGSKIAKHMINRVKKQTRNGSIILSHDMLKPWTVTAYKTLLPWLKQRYTLIPMSAAKLPAKPTQPQPSTPPSQTPPTAATPTTNPSESQPPSTSS